MYEVTEIAELLSGLRGAIYELQARLEDRRSGAPLDFDNFNRLDAVLRAVDYVEDLFEPIELLLT